MGKWRIGPLGIGLVVAAATAVASLGVNLYVTSNAFRRSVLEDRRSRLQRNINFLILLQDELKRAERDIAQGDLDLSYVGIRLRSPRSKWPTQLWDAMRYSVNVLNTDSSLVQQLASVYEEMEHASSLLEDAENSYTAHGLTEGWLDVMTESMRQSGERPSTRYKEIASEEREATIASYSASVTRIRERLPAVIAAIEVALNDLRRQLSASN